MIANVPDAWNNVCSVAYSADRRLFAAGREDGSIWFWEEIDKRVGGGRGELYIISHGPNVLCHSGP